jgi:hypothetical protein
MVEPKGTMTLAFELSALKKLKSPGEAFENARSWSKYVGVVTDEPTYVVTNYTRKKRIRQDFFSGPKGKRESMKSVKQHFDTDRHVLLITDEIDEIIAEETGWECIRIEEAAEKAGWELGMDELQETIEIVEDKREDWP